MARRPSGDRPPRPRDPGELVVKYRLDQGLCFQCGTQLFETTDEPGNSRGHRRLVARDIPGVVRSGRCLFCYPDDGPAAGPPAAAAISPSPRRQTAAVAVPCSLSIGTAADQPTPSSRRARGGGDDSSFSALGRSSIESCGDECSVVGGRNSSSRAKRTKAARKNEEAEDAKQCVTIKDTEGTEYTGILTEGTAANGRGRFSHVHVDGQFEGKESFYEGEIKNGRFHGRGKSTHAGGTTYDGEFQRGVAHGHGTCQTIGDGAWVYTGEWKKDQRHGKGTWSQLEEGGEVYEGEFKHDKWHGKGKLLFAGGGDYDGEFKNDKLEGRGIYTFSDGSLYEGFFKNDLREGQGTMTYADGLKYIGQWKNNWRHGEGQLFNLDGSVFQGQFREDKKDGIGTLIMPDRTSKKETWTKGILKQEEGLN